MKFDPTSHRGRAITFVMPWFREEDEKRLFYFWGATISAFGTADYFLWQLAYELEASVDDSHRRGTAPRHAKQMINHILRRLRDRADKRTITFAEAIAEEYDRLQPTRNFLAHGNVFGAMSIGNIAFLEIEYVQPAMPPDHPHPRYYRDRFSDKEFQTIVSDARRLARILKQARKWLLRKGYSRTVPFSRPGPSDVL